MNNLNDEILALREENRKLKDRIQSLQNLSGMQNNYLLISGLYLNIFNASRNSTNMLDLFRTIHGIMQQIISAKNFFIALYDKERDIITFPYFIDEQDSPFSIIGASNSNSLTATVIRDKKTLFADREYLVKRFIENDNEPIGTLPQMWVGIPLIISGEVIGVVGFQSYDNPNIYTREEFNLLESASAFIAIAIEQKIFTERSEKDRRNYDYMFNEMLNGYALHEVITDPHGTPIDYRFLQVNKAYEDITGLKGNEIIGKTVKEIIPDVEDIWIKNFGTVALKGEPIRFADYNKALNKYFEVAAYAPEYGKFAVIVNEIKKLAQ